MITNPTAHRQFSVLPVMRMTKLDFDPARAVAVDLDRTPSRGKWEDVRFDDRGVDANNVPVPQAPCLSLMTGYQVTSIGGYTGVSSPDNLVQGCMVGALYIEDSYFSSVRAHIDLPSDAWPCGYKSYQLTTISYSKNDAINGTRASHRYAGFEARIDRKLGGTQVQVTLYSLSGDAFGTSYSIDLANVNQCDPDPVVDSSAGEVALTSSSNVGDHGALFLELRYIAGLPVSTPKIPLAMAD